MDVLKNYSFEVFGLDFDAHQLVMIGLVGLGLGVLGYLLNEYLFSWYYNREETLDRNKSRTKRVVRFVATALFIIASLRILDLDYTFFDSSVQEEASDDGPPVYLTIRISTFVKALAAFVVANVLDLLLEELLTQTYYAKVDKEESEQRSTTVDHESIVDSFSSLRPLLYSLVLIFLAVDLGIDHYSFHNFRNARRELTGQITLGHILRAVAIFFLVRLLLKVLVGFVLRTYYGRSKLDVGSQFAINRLITYFVYLIGVLLVVQAMGFDLLVIWTGAAALLVGIGIGLQQTFNDLICGVIILFERSVKVGDVVELTGHQVGTVRKIGARTSVVESRDDIIIFVPNSKLIGENVTNWSQVSRIARFHVHVGVAYGSDTALVKKILLDVANAHPRVLKQPPPIVRFLDFGDSSLNFDVLFYSRDFLRIEDVKSDVRFAIDEAFRKDGVEIPFPQRDIWIRGGEVKE